MVFEHLKRIAKRLDLKPQVAEGVDDKGNKVPLLILEHGTHKLLAIESEGYTLVFYSLEVKREDGALLAREPPEIQQTLFSIVKRELAEGRSGYRLVFDETRKPPELREIRVEQKIILRDEQPATIQRVADGVQELVVVAIRCILVLGQAFQDVRAAAQTSATAYHAGMYA